MPVGRDTHRDGTPRADRGVPFIRDTGTPVSEPVDWFRYPYETISDAEASDPDLGDLVDPQNDTYEEEGTHGLPLAIGAAAKAYGKFRKTPTGKVVEAAAIEKGTEVFNKGVDYVTDEGNQDRAREALHTGLSKSKGAISKVVDAGKNKLKGKGGAGLASPASEGVGTPEGDDLLA